MCSIYVNKAFISRSTSKGISWIKEPNRKLVKMCFESKIILHWVIAHKFTCRISSRWYLYMLWWWCFHVHSWVRTILKAKLEVSAPGNRILQLFCLMIYEENSIHLKNGLYLCTSVKIVLIYAPHLLISNVLKLGNSVPLIILT